MPSLPLQAAGASTQNALWPQRSIAGPRLRLVEFTGFMEAGGLGALTDLKQELPRSPEYVKHIFVHLSSNAVCEDPDREVSFTFHFYF